MRLAMKDLAPEITRIRLLIEGFFSGSMDEDRVKAYLLKVADELGLKTYGTPVIHSPAGIGSDHNQGFDAFVPRSTPAFRCTSGHSNVSSRP